MIFGNFIENYIRSCAEEEVDFPCALVNRCSNDSVSNT
jgi:hypothetical protein